MKFNKVLLHDQLRNKLMGEAVCSIITEAFLKSVPFNSAAIIEESAGLAQYCTNVVRTMHPETLIDRAIEAATNPMHKEYLETLKSELSAIVENAVGRIQSSNLGVSTTPEIVKQAKLDDAEVDALSKAGQKIGIDAVSEIVKKKVIDTIKDERDSYEKAEKLTNEIKSIIRDENQELKDSLSQDDDTENPEAEDATVESYYNIILSSTDPRHPVSVFSRLQDVCMENLLFSTESYEGEIPYKTLEKITLESTFPYFDLGQYSLLDEAKALQVSLEAEMASQEMTPDEKANKVKAISKTSLICTICIMTVLEVLKTMNLMKPDLSMVRDFVDRQTNVQNASDDDIERIGKKIDSATADMKKSVALGALSATETAQAKEVLSKVRAIVESMHVAPNRVGLKTSIINRLNAAIEMTLPETTQEIRVDTISSRIRETNITNLEHSINVVSRRPDVASVNVIVDSTTPMGDDNSSVVVRVTGVDSAGNTVCEDFFQFCTAKFLGANIATAMRDTMTNCNLKLGHKPVSLFFKDQGYSVPLDKPNF